ncbi:MAG: hypothetical protein ACTHMY_16635 [Solirubrobacteraceae bacterium]
MRAATAAGLPASDIAGRLGRSPDRIRARRRTLLGALTAARPYRPDEDAQIRRYVENGGDLVLLAHRLGRSPDALRLHAQHLGLLHPVSRRRWAEWEDAVLRDGYTSALPYVEIARQLPHRTPTGLAARARKLELISYARRWSSLEDQRVAQLTASGRPLEDIAQRLGRTPEAIRRRAKRLGIAPPRPAPAPRRTRRWTNGEDDLLRLHHALNPARLAELLGRSDVAVCRRLSVLGLRAGAGRSPHHPAGHRADVSTSARRRSAKADDVVLGVNGRPVRLTAGA